MELMNSIVSLRTRPSLRRWSKVSSDLKKVSRSISHSAPCSRASFMMVAGERSASISERIRASYAIALPVRAEKTGWNT